MKSHPNRPIDRRRDAAVSIKIGSSDDGTIAALVPIGDRLLAVTNRAIYAIQLADQVDPQRTNPAVPDSQQRVLDIGADDPIVAKLLLTAHELFKAAQLGRQFDESEAMRLAWNLTKHVAAMAKLQETLDAAQNAAIEGHKSTTQGTSLRLPTIATLEASVHAFAQKLGHAIDAMKGIARLFYPELPKKWIDGLTELTSARFGLDDPFTKYIYDVRPALLLWRGLRNVIEHPRPERSATIHDFRLTPEGSITMPSLELPREGGVHTVPTVEFMKQTVGDITVIAEVMIAHICNANIQQTSVFDVRVMEMPLGQRRHSGVRLYYGVEMSDGQTARVG